MEKKIVAFKEEYTDLLYELIESTIKKIYASEYNDEVIKYFLSYNTPDHILKDFKEGYTALYFFDNKLAGSGCLVDKNIRRLFVLPEYQRIGVGTEIMKHLEHKAISNNKNFLELYSMTLSREFYIKLGYSILGLCNYGIDITNSANYIRMAKSLVSDKFQNHYHLNNKKFKIKDSVFSFLIGEEVLFIQQNNLVRAIFPKREKYNEELIGIISNDYLNLDYNFVNGDINYSGQGKYKLLKNRKKEISLVDENNYLLFYYVEKR